MTAAAGPVAALTAFALEVPEAEACVGELRARHDPSCALGVQAHITVLYPFMAPSAIARSPPAFLPTRPTAACIRTSCRT